MDKTKLILKYSSLLFSCAFFLGGCSSYSSHMDEMLHDYVCKRDASYKVGPEREVIFYVKHHIMVGEKKPGTDQWDATGFTRTPGERISWENSRFALYRKESIPTLMQGVNEILYDNDTNIYLVNDTIEIHADEQFFPADFDLLANPRGHTREVMERVVAEEPGYIHILYGWTSSTKLLAAGDRFAVVVADDPRYGSRITSLDLTREIINSLGYQPKVDSDAEGNLLHHTATSDSLSDDQILALWDVINEKNQMLKSISCELEE